MARIGGHVGLTLPIVMFGGSGTKVIGNDFVDLGAAYGITIKLSQKFAVDFESVITEPLKQSAAECAPIATVATICTAPPKTVTYIIDPGVVYDFGPLAVGGRVAFNILQPQNFGIIPIVHKGFSISDRLAFS